MEESLCLEVTLCLPSSSPQHTELLFIRQKRGAALAHLHPLPASMDSWPHGLRHVHRIPRGAAVGPRCVAKAVEALKELLRAVLLRARDQPVGRRAPWRSAQPGVESGCFHCDESASQSVSTRRVLALVTVSFICGPFFWRKGAGPAARSGR